MNLFIDTNIFLSFFHLSSDDLEEIHKLAVLIDKGQVTLWLTAQVKDEFFRNRENKISDAIKKLKEQQLKPQFPQICKDYPEYQELSELQKAYAAKMSSLMKNVNADIDSLTLKADLKISELFEKSKIIPTTSDLVEKARLRRDVRNPPGKDGSLGDAINWEAMLQFVPPKQDIYLIADDKDYYSVLDENKVKDFLANEWQSTKASKLYFYRRLSQFFKEHYPEIKLASELEKEFVIRSLVNSGNFANTHNAIEKLSKYAEFNKSQAAEIAQAALFNNQVGWIFSDDDVHDFYSKFWKNHSALLEKEIQDNLSHLLTTQVPVHDESA